MGQLEELNKSVVLRFGKALNNRDLTALDDLVTPGFMRHCQATPGLEIRSLDEFKRFLEADWAGAPDSVSAPRFTVAEGDLVAIYCTYAGTQTGQWGPIPPTGRRVEFDYSGVFRLENGRIAELWITWDNMAVLAQLGCLPPMPATSS